MKISIIMGTHNGEQVLTTAIESIQAQTITDWQLIICNDNSTDRTQTLLEDYASLDPRIKLLKNNQQSGLSYALNRCIAYSHGEFIARMDDDDICHPERLAQQLAAFAQHPQVSLVGCNATLFSEKDGNYGERNVPQQPTADQVFHGQNFIHPTVMIRRADLLSVGGYTVSRHVLRAEDFDLWCKLYAHGFIGINLPQRLFYYREDQRNVRRRNAQQYRNVAYIMHAWQSYLPLTAKNRLYPLVPLLKSWVPTILVQRLHYRQHFAREE